MRAANTLCSVKARPEALDALAAAATEKDPIVALAAARALVAHRDVRGIPALIELGKVKESADLDIDDEDADLLAGLSVEVLSAAAGTNGPRDGETWGRWWSRVRHRYRYPRRVSVPEFPPNH